MITTFLLHLARVLVTVIVTRKPNVIECYCAKADDKCSKTGNCVQQTFTNQTSVAPRSNLNVNYVFGLSILYTVRKLRLCTLSPWIPCGTQTLKRLQRRRMGYGYECKTLRTCTYHHHYVSSRYRGFISVVRA